LQDTQQQADLQAWCAAALYPRGGTFAEAATHLIMSVLKDIRDAPAALRQYAVIAADRQLWGEVAKAAVLLLAVAPRDRQGQQLLAKAVQVRRGTGPAHCGHVGLCCSTLVGWCKQKDICCAGSTMVALDRQG
jgi:hypothetical protein